MVDVVNPVVRSRMMAGIGGRDTQPEIALRRCLPAAGLRFRLHVRDLPGRPDIVLRRYNAAIFVHGCFWHRHPGCPKTTNPSTRPDFWAAKFAANVSRDQRNLEDLLGAGWRAAIVWECSLEGTAAARNTRRIVSWIRTSKRQLEVP